MLEAAWKESTETGARKNSRFSRRIGARLQSADPTHTIGIRTRWLNETDRRFNELKRSITETIKKNDALRLEERNEGETGRQGRGVQGLLGSLQAALQAAQAFVFTRDDQAINAMMAWLREEEKNNVLEIHQRPDPITGDFGEPWTNTYVRSSYSKGLAQANAELAAAGAAGVKQTVQAAFNQPFHIDRLRLVYTRVFTDLEGVTATMNAAIRRELTTGMLEGIGPTEMAKRINDRVDKIGVTRAKLIARTEAVLAHNQASLGEYERASAIIGEEVLVKWVTAGGNVRPKHVTRRGEIFTQAGYASRIGEPNCRCSGTPYIPNIEGKPERVNAVP
jgi:SPP1 gp7 family putative phage head morphogenesis protein